MLIYIFCLCNAICHNGLLGLGSFTNKSTSLKARTELLKNETFTFFDNIETSLHFTGLIFLGDIVTYNYNGCRQIISPIAR